MKHATSDASKVIKNLFAGSDAELKAVKSAYAQVRTFVYDNTLPYTSTRNGARRGPRLLASTNSLPFMKEYNVLQQEALSKLDELKQTYPQRVQQAVSNLGGMGNASEYPDVSELDSMFEMSIDFDPVPAQASFANMSLPPQMADFFIKRMEKRQSIAVENALTDIKGRILEELTRITKQLSRHADGEKVRLYKSLVGNIKRLNGMLRSTNLSGNTELEELCDAIDDKLCKHDIETLKASPGKAQEVADDAKALASAVDDLELF
jgi:hypothetical protein